MKHAAKKRFVSQVSKIEKITIVCRSLVGHRKISDSEGQPNVELAMARNEEEIKAQDGEEQKAC